MGKFASKCIFDFKPLHNWKVDYYSTTYMYILRILHMRIGIVDESDENVVMKQNYLNWTDCVIWSVLILSITYNAMFLESPQIQFQQSFIKQKLVKLKSLIAIEEGKMKKYQNAFMYMQTTLQDAHIYKKCIFLFVIPNLSNIKFRTNDYEYHSGVITVMINILNQKLFAYINMLFFKLCIYSVCPTDIEGRSQNSYTALSNGIVSHGAPIGVFKFLDHTHGNKHKQNVLFSVSCVFIFCSGRSTYTPDESRLFWSWEELKYPQLEPHSEIKMTQVLGSPVYICVPSWNIN